MSTGRRQARGWALMIVVLGAELLGMLWVLFNMFGSVVRDVNNPDLGEFRSTVITQGISLLVVLVCATAWTLMTLVGAFRRRGWSRASNLTIQILVVAAATGILQGILGAPLLGWALLFAALIGIIGMFLSRPPRDAHVR